MSFVHGPGSPVKLPHVLCGGRGSWPEIDIESERTMSARACQELGAAVKSRLRRVAFLTLVLLAISIGASQQTVVAMKSGGQVAIASPQRPNIVLILADDVGYGDLGSYGSKTVPTPNLDRLARGGLRFTSAYASSATCTPSRYSLLTGTYAWRQKNTGIAPGDAPLLIRPGTVTVPSVLKGAGYTSAIIGKWHLGLGTAPQGPEWNGELKPGPLELGFDYAFIIPATLDRVPTVYVEDHRVVGLQADDPITVSYQHRIPHDGPVYADYVAQHQTGDLKLLPSDDGHVGTIIDGVPRIGYMSGGRAARWVDESMPDLLLKKTEAFIRGVGSKPFFLEFASPDIHVPQMVDARFQGKSGYGPRGDALLRLDWEVGQIMQMIQRQGLSDRTLILFTSDNGAVLDDGYATGARERYHNMPEGPLRGGKYSQFEGGTRVPLIAYWPGTITPSRVTDAILSQVDLLASFAHVSEQPLPVGDFASGAPQDSTDYWDVLIGKSGEGRRSVVESANSLGLRQGDWKYISPNAGSKLEAHVETGNSKQAQVYDLAADLGERRNIASSHPGVQRQLKQRLDTVVKDAPKDYRLDMSQN
jgi:arylsulfatase A-like enzyme